jgi:hypothetical protein
MDTVALPPPGQPTGKISDVARDLQPTRCLTAQDRPRSVGQAPGGLVTPGAISV